MDYDDKKNEWSGVPKETTITDGVAVLVLDNGAKIISFGDHHQAGASVHVLTSDNRQIAMWEVSEWEQEGEGESVMGAILRSAGNAAALPPVEQV